MGDLIEQFGFWGYMTKFPVNPISMVGALVIAGIVILFANARIRRRGANRFLQKNPGAAIMTLHKKQIGNADYADQIRFIKLNGENASWFFLKPAIPAIYLKSGENTIELYAEWARGTGAAIKRYKSNPVTIAVSAAAGGRYSLEYYIPESRFVYEPYDNPHLFENARREKKR